MSMLYTKQDGLVAHITWRLFIAVVLFAAMDVTFVVASYAGNVQELGQRLLSKQASEILAALDVIDTKIVYDKTRLIREHIGNAHLAFAVYDRQGREIILSDPANLASSLMPPITSVSEETRRDEYSNSFRLRGIRRLTLHHPTVDDQ
ncbi:MAG: hypothetical protein K2Q32_07720, partial [Alphaproteobacteria bacterium]|nr:hypothetical protein [Alphaproteobacteria bacterium]